MCVCRFFSHSKLSNVCLPNWVIKKNTLMMFIPTTCLHTVKCEGQVKPTLTTQQPVWPLTHQNIWWLHDFVVMLLTQPLHLHHTKTLPVFRSEVTMMKLCVCCSRLWSSSNGWVTEGNSNPPIDWNWNHWLYSHTITLSLLTHIYITCASRAQHTLPSVILTLPYSFVPHVTSLVFISVLIYPCLPSGRTICEKNTVWRVGLSCQFCH